MQIPPDATPAWFLAEILKVIRGPDLLGPARVDPTLLRKWRVGRLIDELRSFRVADDIATRTTPTRGNLDRFPWGASVISDLEADILKAGIEGYSRPTLFRCLAIGAHVGAAVDLPRRTKWQTVKAWGTQELRTKLKPGSTARNCPFDPEHTRERILRGLASIHPEAVVYRLMPGTDPLIEAPDAVVMLLGRPAFTVRVQVGATRRIGRSQTKSGPSSLPVLTVRITNKGRKRRLAWTPRSGGPLAAATVGRWLQDLLDGDAVDPYDRDIPATR